LNPTALKVITVQVVLTAVFTVVVLVLQGQLAGFSALCGGLVIVLGNLAYAFIARPHKVNAVSGNQVLMRHVLAEVAKILIALSSLFGAFASNKFEAVWLIAAVGVALLGHGLSLLIVKTN
jgi:ATP synthase protein I